MCGWLDSYYPTCLLLTAHGVAKSGGEGEAPSEESSEGGLSWHAG
jgi:hypothetical protein